MHGQEFQLNQAAVDQRMVYELDGMGQRHFYFRSDQLIIWLAVDVRLAEDALRQVLILYP
jgi:hypothetical protein